jgi:phosphatidate phosphatase PAH1
MTRLAMTRFAMLFALAGAMGCGPGEALDDVEYGQGPAPLYRCETTFTPPPRGSFRHWYNRALALGPSQHSAQDLIVKPGGAVTVEGKFAYGSVSKDLEGEPVQLYFNDCTSWRSIGSGDTDSDGRARVRLTAPTAPGIYGLRMVVRGDSTYTHAYLFVPPAGARLSIFDIDGTLTTSDLELVKDVVTDLFEPILHGTYDPKPHPYARELVEEREKRGALPIYLTGRPYWLNQSSRDWLALQRLPAGPLHTTDSTSEAVTRVAEYKAAFLNSLSAQGFVLEAAYGNASTDITAYATASIAKSVTYIIGENGGKEGTHGACATNPTCKTWEEEVRRLRALP